MKFLILAVLVVAASATYGHNRYYGSSYGSYPHSYSSYYGSGYGSGLYGTGYSGSYGGIGRSYYGGSYGAYKPAVYQTSKTSGTWSQEPSYQTGAHETVYQDSAYTTGTLGAPSKISGVSKVSGLHGSGGVVGIGTQHVTSVKTAEQSSAGHKTAVHDWKTTDVQTEQMHSPFSQEISKTIGQSVTTTARPETHPYDRIVVPVVPGSSTGSSHGFGTNQATGAHFVKTVGDQTHGSFVPSVKDQSTLTVVEPDVDTFDKVLASPPKQSTRYVQRPVPVHRGESHGLSSLGGPRISFIMGHPGQDQQGNKKIIYDRPTVPKIVPSSSSGSSHGFGTNQGTGAHFVKTVGGQTHGSFVPHVKDQSTLTVIEPEVHTFDKVLAPPPKQSTRYIQRHRGESHGISSLGGPRISFIMGYPGHDQQGNKKIIYDRPTVPKIVPSSSSGSSHGFGTNQGTGAHFVKTVGGQTHSSFVPSVKDQSTFTVIEPEVNTFDRVVASPPKQSTRYVQRPVSVHRGESHGLSSLGGPRISFIMGHPGQDQQGDRKIIYDRPTVPKIVPRPPYRTEAVSKVSPIPVTPSRISFTQDYSKITGHQRTKPQPAVSVFDRSTTPAFPVPVGIQDQHVDKRNKVFHTSPVKPAQVITTVQTEVQQPISRQIVEERIYTENISPIGGSLSHVAGDKSPLVAELGPTGFGHSSDYKKGVEELNTQVITGSTFVDNVNGKSAFVQVPAEGFVNEKSPFFQTAQIGSVDDKGFQYSTGVLNPGIPTHGVVGRSQRYSLVTEPFKSYYSSSYPGYSHISGESPRYDFSPDKNHLYSYTSPYLVSPFSYTYTTGSKHYGQKPLI